MLHCSPFGVDVQVERSSVVGLTLRVGVPQLQGTEAVLAGPLNTSMALAGQTVVAPTRTITCVCAPGASTPLAGLKLTEEGLLLFVDQGSRLCWLVFVNVAKHIQP